MNDLLIEQLTSDLKPVKPLRNVGLWQHCTMCLLIAIALILSILGIRPDWREAIQGGALLWKPAIFLLIWAASLFVVTDLSRPSGKVKILHLSPFLVAAAILLWRLISQEIDFNSLHSNTAYYCLSIIALGGAMAMTAAWFFWIKKTASPRPAILGALAGVNAGSLVAVAYALHCNQDSVLYLAAYYLVPLLILALTGAVLGKKMLNW